MKTGIKIVDDAANVVSETVQAVVEKPGSTLVGAALAGPAGAVVGAVLTQTEKAAEEQAMRDYIDQYNRAIEEVRSSKPNFEELEKIWKQMQFDAALEFYRIRYEEDAPPQDVAERMARKEVKRLRDLMTDAEFQSQLENLHKLSVDASIKQLEHERDNSERSSQPPDQSNGDALEKFFEEFLAQYFKWAVERLSANFDGAKNESGVLAQVLRGTSGVSWDSIKKYGLLGGENSYLRKIIPTWKDGGGVFGGSDSFFRKPFG